MAEDAEQDPRERKTRWLLIAGVASLILPLLLLLVMRLLDNGAVAQGGAVTFERREAGESKINVSPTVIPPSTPAPAGAPEPARGSSLDFVKASADLKEKPKPAPAPPPQPAAPPQLEPEQQAQVEKTVAAATQAAVKSSSRKAFNPPKLKPSNNGFGDFAGKKGGRGQGGLGQQNAQQGGQGGGDLQDLLKNLPPAAQGDPAVQKALQGQN